MMKPLTGALAFCVGLFCCGLLQAAPQVYAIVIGNNAPPPNSELKTLRYADDDALRYYQFFKRLSNHVFLLTVPDARTQSRYPKITPAAEIPSMANFERILNTIGQQIETAERQGKETVFYFAFSGHGTFDQSGDPYLVLHDGALTGKRLYDGLARLKTDFQHLFIDACHAEGVVGTRGMFDREVDGQHVKLSAQDIKEIAGKKRRTGFPGLGIILSSSEHQKTHEWSQIESGIFTHEVLSGLSGPADINLDGKIEYSELVAFVSVANREVKDERGKITVVATPPPRNRSIPIVDLNMLSKVAFVVGDPSSLGHFIVELENGERYADANLGDMKYMHMAIPSDQKAYLLTKNGDAALNTNSNPLIELADLDYTEQQYSERGSIEEAFQKGLFSAVYGQRYYNGFVDSSGLAGVQFGVPRFEHVSKTDTNLNFEPGYKKPLAITGFGLSVVSTGLAVTFGVLALQAREDYYSTKLQVPSMNANEKYNRYRTVFWISAGLVPVTALAGWLFWPKKPKRKNKNSASSQVRFDGQLLTVEFY